MNPHILGALCFLPPRFPNNLIFNNIDFRYGFAFYRYLHFFSITFPGSAFVVLPLAGQKRRFEGCSRDLWAPNALKTPRRRSETTATARFFQRPARVPSSYRLNRISRLVSPVARQKFASSIRYIYGVLVSRSERCTPSLDPKGRLFNVWCQQHHQPFLN